MRLYCLCPVIPAQACLLVKHCKKIKTARCLHVFEDSSKKALPQEELLNQSMFSFILRKRLGYYPLCLVIGASTVNLVAAEENNFLLLLRVLGQIVFFPASLAATDGHVIHFWI